MEFDPFDLDVIRDPYPAYAGLRRLAPLAPTRLGFSVVSRYRDVLFALRHPELFSSSAMNDLIEGLKAMGPTSERIEGGSTLLGTDPPVHMIANAVLALLANPDALTRVRREACLVPALVEEALRYDSPVQLTLRRATQDLEFAGGKLRAGENVGLLLGSANRDESEFEAADRFDLRRNASAHLAFGFGTHFCLGAGLARLEARIALEALLIRPERFELADCKIEHPPSLITRGPKRVQLRFA